MESSLPSSKSQLGDGEGNPENILADFPRKNGLCRPGQLYQFQGFWYKDFLKGTISAQAHFQAQPSDIILASCPKTGTTWIKSLCFAIVTRAHFNASTSPLLSKNPHDCVPFLEFDLTAFSKFSRDMALPVLATHVPFTSLPGSVMASPGCKVVYIWRDPKDTFVSLWHFNSKILVSRGHEPFPLEEAFELFCQGLHNYGPYWDHVAGYLKASQQNPNRVLVFKYEEMRKDTVKYVKKLADIVGYPFTYEEERDGAVDKIISTCSLEKLSGLEVNKSGKHRGSPISNAVYFRKGEVGDWQNFLTQEMGARLDKIMKHKLETAGLKMV